MKTRQNNYARRVAHAGLALLGAALLLVAAPGTWAQTYTNLHTFAGGANDGAQPVATTLTLSGTNLYGMTYIGGAGNGVIFKLNADGSGYTNLHAFTGSVSDGALPIGSLTLSGTNLYGMTQLGGLGDGVVFSINTDGSGYTNLHTFIGGVGDAAYPYGNLTLSGSTLYGITDSGGASANGVIFKVNTDGSGYTNLHEFAGGASDGSRSLGSLILSGTTLYGMTEYGGASSRGVIFKLNTDGSGYTNLHAFAGGASDGEIPYYASLTLDGTTLYGMTHAGGASNMGVVFQLNTDGSGYTNLHEFAGGAGDGNMPYATLSLSGTTLYGMTPYGGTSDGGVVFQMNTDGSGYTNLHSFANGWNPTGSLTLSGSDLFGMTRYGGSGNGVIFALSLPSPQVIVTVAANPTSGGDVTGGGTYGSGTNIQLAATASNNWLFMAWNDGATNNPYTITVPATNITYTANFAAAATISVAASTNIGGSVTGGGTFIIGSNAVLSATASNGWMFTGWNNGSTNNPLAIVVASNATYTANFALPATLPAQFFFQDSGGQVAALLLETNGNILSSTLFGTAGSWQLKAAGDVDGDGISDLLFQTVGGGVYIWFMNINNTVKCWRYVGYTADWQVRACADYDGDGRTEIFFQNAAGDCAYWQTTTLGACTNAVLLGNTGEWQLKTAVDVDGDGKADLFWQRADGLVAAWFHNGAAINAVLLGNTGGWGLRAAADVDGDGCGDLAWQTADGKVGAWFMNANGTPRAASFWWSTGGWQLKAASN